jgi:hypothetical protein
MLLLSNGGKVMAKQRRVFRQSTTVDAMRKIRKPRYKLVREITIKT